MRPHAILHDLFHTDILWRRAHIVFWSSAFFTQLCTHTQPASAQQARSLGILRVVCREVFAERPLSLHRPLMHYEVCILVAPRKTSPSTTSGSLFPRLHIVSRPMFRQRHALQASTSEDVPIFTDGGTHTSDGETTAGRGAIARSPRGMCYVVSGPVVAGEAHTAFAGARQQTKHWELCGIVESLQFPMPLRLVLRDSHVCIFFDSQHAADVCLGSVQPRTNVRHAGISQQFLLHVQLRFPLHYATLITLRHSER